MEKALLEILALMFKQQVELRRRCSEADVELGQLPHFLQNLYKNRGLVSASDCSVELKDLIPASSLMNVEKAAALLHEAIAKQKRILIIGDFDADGATATVLAVRGLRMFGAASVDYLVPNRFKFGYGLTPEIVDAAIPYAPDILVTVDNGISSVEGVNKARALGWEVLVTDHHLPGNEVPNANVIVNPNQEGDGFTSKALSGVGVMFYVLVALRQQFENQDGFDSLKQTRPNLSQLLDLVALGTVADLVPLDKNNRILVEQGLRRIRSGQSVPGIRALLALARRNPGSIEASDLGFTVAPRLNAAGRIEEMSIGIECLLTDDPVTAEQYANRLDRINQERKTIEADMKESALVHVGNLMDEMDGNALPYGLCLYEENWHQGVIGILASRIKELIHRPVIAFAPEDDVNIKGSARSIPGLHIRDTLDLVAARHPELLSRFGGHAMAAGLSIRKDNIEAFREAFNSTVKELVDEEQLTSVLWTDGELGAEDLNLATAKMIRDSGPWGQGFPEPLFEGVFRILKRTVVGEKHLKLLLQAEADGVTVNAIQFFYDEQEWPENSDQYLLAYKPGVNEYRGLESLQLIVKYARAHN